MSKKNEEIGKAQGITEAQIKATQEQAARSGQFGDWYKQLATTAGGNLQDIIGQYLPGLQSQMGTLQGQQGNLFDIASGTTQAALDPRMKMLAEGYSPEAKSALISQAVSGTPGQFNTAISNLKSQMGSRGFGGAGGMGNLASMMGDIYSQREQTKAAQLAGITTGEEALRNQNINANNAMLMQNKNLTLQGMLNAIGAGSNLYGQGLNTLGTMASIYDPTKYMALANTTLGQQGSDIATGMQGAGIRANQLKTGFWDQFGGALMGAGLSAGLGALTGGASLIPGMVGAAKGALPLTTGGAGYSMPSNTGLSYGAFNPWGGP